MELGPELTDLLRRIVDGQARRSELARWMATHSSELLDSPSEIDRMIVTELDIALGEIQKGAANEELLVSVAKQLIDGMALKVGPPVRPKRL